MEYNMKGQANCLLIPEIYRFLGTKQTIRVPSLIQRLLPLYALLGPGPLKRYLSAQCLIFDSPRLPPDGVLLSQLGTDDAAQNAVRCTDRL